MFKPIETQEELEKVLAERLNRDKAKYAKQLEDYDELKSQKEKLEADLKAKDDEAATKAKEYEGNIADLNSKIGDFEKASLRTKVALNNGLPIDFADRLMGDDEESLKADAERLSGFVKNNAPTPPLKDNEGGQVGDSKDAAYKELANNLNMEEV